MMRRILSIVAVTVVWNASLIASKTQQTQPKNDQVPCGDLTTQSEMNQCFAKAAQGDQAKLDALLKELAGVLEKSEVARLTAVQKLWTGYRNAHCQWQAPSSERYSMQPTEYATCLSSAIWNRI